MKRVLNALILLYPKSWRNRYKNEFKALLDDIPPTWRTFFDVLGGALKMQMRIWSSWKIVPVFAALGLLGAAVFSLTIPNRYVSTAVIRIEDGGLKGVGSIIERMQSRSALVSLINDQGLYKNELSRVPLEDVVRGMKARDIQFAPFKSSKGDLPAISISFASENAATAQRTTDGLVHRFMEAGLEGNAHTFAVIDPPSPAVQVGPRRPRILTMGILVGISAGILFVLFSGLKVWKNAAILGVAGAILSGAASYLEPERYSSVAVLGYLPADQAKVSQAVNEATSSGSLHALVVKFGLYSNAARAEDRLREHLHVRQINDDRIVSIDFNYPDQRTVHSVTQAVVAQLIKDNWNFETIDAASFPQRPFFPNRSMAAGTGLVLGFLIATILRVKERRVKLA